MKFITFAILLFSLPTFAVIENFQNNNTSQIAQGSFQDLEAFFDLADVPNYDEVEGWHSGKCFAFNEPTHPIAYLLVGHTSGGAGKIMSFYAPEGKVDFFDHMSSSLQKTIDDYINVQFEYYTKAAEGAGSLFSAPIQSKYDGTLEFHVRKKLGYLTMSAVATRNVGDLQKGDSYAYCIYQNKVK